MEPHSTSLYVPRGRGILYIAEWSGTTPPTSDAYVDIGNCPSFEIEPVVERDPHYSSRTGLKTKDLNPIIQSEYTFSFTCDEMAAKNLERFFAGTLDTSTGIISALTNSDKEFAFKFVSDNPIGPNQEFRLWRATITPNGPLALIGDSYLVMDFAGEGLSDVTNHSSSPYFDIKTVTTTTTTSTSSTTTTTA